ALRARDRDRGGCGSAALRAARQDEPVPDRRTARARSARTSPGALRARRRLRRRPRRAGVALIGPFGSPPVPPCAPARPTQPHGLAASRPKRPPGRRARLRSGFRELYGFFTDPRRADGYTRGMDETTAPRPSPDGTRNTLSGGGRPCVRQLTRRRSGAMRAIASFVVLVLLLAGTTGAATTPAQRCQSAKNKAAGKYAACRLNAEAKFA